MPLRSGMNKLCERASARMMSSCDMIRSCWEPCTLTFHAFSVKFAALFLTGAVFGDTGMLDHL